MATVWYPPIAIALKATFIYRYSLAACCCMSATRTYEYIGLPGESMETIDGRWSSLKKVKMTQTPISQIRKNAKRSKAVLPMMLNTIHKDPRHQREKSFVKWNFLFQMNDFSFSGWPGRLGLDWLHGSLKNAPIPYIHAYLRMRL